MREKNLGDHDTTAFEAPMRELASSAGSSWAGEVRDDLLREGRRVVGMWPGTLSEARALATQVIRAALCETPTPDLRERVARAVYAAARGRWRQWSAREEPEI